MKITIPRVALGTLAVVALTIAGTWLFGGFEGLGSGGAFALILGITVSFAIGIGLMAAIFYSNRQHDEEVHLAAREQFRP